MADDQRVGPSSSFILGRLWPADRVRAGQRYRQSQESQDSNCSLEYCHFIFLFSLQPAVQIEFEIQVRNQWG